MDDVALIDQAHAGSALNRRGDGRIAKLDARVVDGGLIVLNGGLILRDQRVLRIEALSCRKILGQERPDAAKVELGIGQKRFVAKLVGFGLLKQSLIRSRIDLGEKVAGLYVLSLAKCDLLHLAIDANLDRHRIVGLHGAQPDPVDRKILSLGDPCGNGDRPRGARISGTAHSPVKGEIGNGCAQDQ